MKKTNLFFMTCKFIMFVLAIAFGGGAMAGNVAGVKYGTDDADPNVSSSDNSTDTTVQTNALQHANKTAPTDKGGLVQHGQMATASALQEANLLDNKMFRKIMEYHAIRYPFYTALFSKATQFAFKGHKEAEYPEIGDIKTEAILKTTINSGGSSKAHTLDIGSCLHANDTYIFRKNYTIIVPSVEGYDENGNHNGESLMLYVTDNNDSGSVKVEAINGPLNNGVTYVPEIASGKMLMLGAPALAEEEVEVDPINVIPTMKKAYLQKKGYSVAITDFFNEAVKEVDWEKSRIKRQALDAYKKLYTTTALFGAKRKFNKRNKNGIRLCYTQEGLINQIRMAYQLANGEWTENDVIAIAKMLFTAYTDATSIEIFCGSDAIESLLKIKWNDSTVKVVYQEDDTYKIKVATIETSFGTLKFTHEVALTQFHLEKAAIAIPMEDCMRIYRDNGSTKTVDGNKGETGVVEELKKEFFVQDDCFICNSMASMLIGPASVFAMAGGIEETYVSVTELPAATAAVNGQVYYLTAPKNGYNAGLWKATVTGTETKTVTYTEFKREINA